MLIFVVALLMIGVYIFFSDFGSLLNRKKRQAAPLEVVAEADEAMDPQNNSTRLESVVASENVAVNVNTTTTTTESPIQVPTTTMTPTKRKGMLYN